MSNELIPLAADPYWWIPEQQRLNTVADPAAALQERGITAPREMLPADALAYLKVVSVLWMQNRLIPIQDFRIDPADEGLLLGKGVWESTRTIQGEPWLWPLHIDRMLRSAEVLGIRLQASQLPTAEQVRAYVRELTTEDVILRLNATAGRPGGTSQVWMSAAPQLHYPTALRLLTMKNPVQKGQAYLTLKTFQYATRLQLGETARNTGFDSCLLYDDAGHLLEAAHANIFLRLPTGWVTPQANGGFLPGTVRQHLLMQAPLPIQEAVVPLEALQQATEVFVTNSNAGIVPVMQIDERSYRVGGETELLQNWLAPTAGQGNRYLFVNRVPVRV